MIQTLYRDMVGRVDAIPVTFEVGLGRWVEACAAHRIAIADKVEVAANGKVFHADEFPDVVEMIESVFHRNGFGAPHHEPMKSMPITPPVAAMRRMASSVLARVRVGIKVRQVA